MQEGPSVCQSRYCKISGFVNFAKMPEFADNISIIKKNVVRLSTEDCGGLQTYRGSVYNVPCGLWAMISNGINKYIQKGKLKYWSYNWSHAWSYFYGNIVNIYM